MPDQDFSDALRRVGRYLEGLQQQITTSLAALEPSGKCFAQEHTADGEARSWARLLEGDTFERAAVHRTEAGSSQIAPTLAERRPELAGAGFDARSLSVIVHPINPYVPTVHANLRCFIIRPAEKGESATFWFGGGFDLTPIYGFEEDAAHFHGAARDACAPFGRHLYPRFKEACDNYFFLPHRNETRGIGGILFDDLESLSEERSAREQGPRERFEDCFDFLRSVGDRLLPAYLPIVERRAGLPFGERELAFQSHRRGRYVEFNLLLDRGTRYGLRSGRRTEAVLSSLPPRAEWRYRWQPDAGSPEALLSERFLEARDWLSPQEPREPD